MTLYVILGIGAAIIIALTVVLARRGAQMKGTDIAAQHIGPAHRFDGARNGAGGGGN